MYTNVINGENSMDHGTVNAYNNLKCRCGACRKAWADYFRERGRQHRRNRQALGLCIECKRPATNGLRCATHAKVNSQVATIRHLRARIDKLTYDIEVGA
jgi:hypothetical protein